MEIQTSFKNQIIIFGLLCLPVSLANAAPILELTPTDSSEIYDVGEEGNKSALNASDVESIFGVSGLQLYYKAEVPENDGDSVPEEGLSNYISAYSTVFSNTATDPADALISYVDGTFDAIVCPECYLVVKDGSQPQYLFNIGSWNGTDSIKLTGFYPNQGAISHVAIFGKTVSVPEPGTLALMGIGLLGLGAFKGRKRS